MSLKYKPSNELASYLESRAAQLKTGLSLYLAPILFSLTGLKYITDTDNDLFKILIVVGVILILPCSLLIWKELNETLSDISDVKQAMLDCKDTIEVERMDKFSKNSGPFFIAGLIGYIFFTLSIIAAVAGRSI